MSDDTTVRIRGAQSGRLLFPALIGHEGPVLSISFSKTGDRIVSSSPDGTLRIWYTSAGAEALHPLRHPLGDHADNNSICHACFSPNGVLIASVSDNGTAVVRNSHSGAQPHHLQADNGAVISHTFLGPMLFAGGDDGTVHG